MSAADWISLGSFVAAAVSASVAVVQARRASASKDAAQRYEAKAELNAERATKAAEEAAAWQRQAAEAAGRSAEALEAQNRMREEQVEQAEGVPWELRYREGDQYELLNTSDVSKFGVLVSGEGVAGGPLAFDHIDGRSSVAFLVAPWGGDNDQIDVKWYSRADRSDEPRQWRGHKPPKL